MSTLYVNNNGDILNNKGRTIETGNRGHLYGDGLFESIRLINGEPISLSPHILRLKEGMIQLKMRIPSFYSAEFFKDKIIALTQKSGISKGGKVRLSIDRLSGGSFLPETNEVSYFIEVAPLNHNAFILNSKGKKIGLFTKIPKYKTIFSNFKVKNALLNVLAAIEAKENDFDDLLLTNGNGNIIEAISSNIFVVSNGILYTPGLEEGCLGGVMRMNIINLALENNIKVYESPISPGNLLSADEIVLTNAINGLTWVSQYKSRSYNNEMAKKITRLLNQHYQLSTFTQHPPI